MRLCLVKLRIIFLPRFGNTYFFPFSLIDLLCDGWWATTMMMYCNLNMFFKRWHPLNENSRPKKPMFFVVYDESAQKASSIDDDSSYKVIAKNYIWFFSAGKYVPYFISIIDFSVSSSDSTFFEFGQKKSNEESRKFVHFDIFMCIVHSIALPLSLSLSHNLACNELNFNGLIK